MISPTSPSALSLHPWVSPKRDDQTNGQHVHHSHHTHQRNQNPQISNSNPNQLSTPDSSNVAQTDLAQQSSSVQSSASNLKVFDLNETASRSFAIDIETKEGDIITISYNEANANHQNAFEYNDANGSSVKGYQAESSSSSEFNISIQGDLNDAEKKSLQDLVGQMQKVGNAFFKDDVKSAYNQAQKMGFDTEQIASFSMSLNMEKSVRAVSAYQQISDHQPVDNKVLKQAGDFYNQATQGLSGNQDALQPFADPIKAFNDIAKGIVDSIASQFPGPDQAQNIDTLKKLLGLASGSVPSDTSSGNASQEPAVIEPSSVDVNKTQVE